MSSEVSPTVLQATGSVARRQKLSRLSRWVLLIATLIGLVVLVVLAIENIREAIPRLNWDFFINYPSRKAAEAGLRSSLFGWIWVVIYTVALSVPIAVGTAVWLEEFAPRSRFITLLRLNISNLAGVPSIIYGILGLTLFVRVFGLGPSMLAGAFTLVLMILPMIVIASVEAIRQVPPSIRDGALALGATRWQAVWHHILPASMPGVMTGTILAIARAAGETAALIMIGAFTFIAFDSINPMDSFTTVPIQIYNWTIRPVNQGFQHNASAGIIVLVAAVIVFNIIALFVRERFRRS